MNWQLNEHQEKFLDKLIDAQTSNKNTIKAVQQMQLRIKEFESEIRKDQMDKSARAVKFSAKRFFIHKSDVEYAIMVSDAEAAIKEG